MVQKKVDQNNDQMKRALYGVVNDIYDESKNMSKREIGKLNDHHNEDENMKYFDPTDVEVT